MKNVVMSLEGSVLVIRVDLGVDLGPSKSLKTTLIASTEGNQPVPGDLPGKPVIGLNVYKKR